MSLARSLKWARDKTVHSEDGMATLVWRLPFTFSSSSTLSFSKRRSYQASFIGMAIDEDDLHNQNSMEMSSESDSDYLWSSLSSFMNDKGQEASAASSSLMELSSSLFNDANSFVMDKEDPAEYIPAPAINAAVKGFVHAVWTLVFPEELRSTLKHPTSSSQKCVQSSSLQLNISGESKFEVDRIGQVVSIESSWCVTKGGQEGLDFIKLLTSVLLKEEHS